MNKNAELEFDILVLEKSKLKYTKFLFTHLLCTLQIE